MKSEVISELICMICENKVKEILSYREKLIENEQKLLGYTQQSEEVTPASIEIVELPRTDPLDQVKNEPEDKSSIIISNQESVCFLNENDSKKIVMKILNDEKNDEGKITQPIFKIISQKEKIRKHRTKNFPLEVTISKNSKIEETPKEKGKIYCLSCKKFVVKSYFQEHREKIHLNKKNFVCDLCDKKFSTHSEIEDHITEHFESEPFMCLRDGCGKKFWKMSQYSKHLSYTHTNSECICDKCAKKFKNSYQLNVSKFFYWILKKLKFSF